MIHEVIGSIPESHIRRPLDVFSSHQVARMNRDSIIVVIIDEFVIILRIVAPAANAVDDVILDRWEVLQASKEAIRRVVIPRSTTFDIPSRRRASCRRRR